MLLALSLLVGSMVTMADVPDDIDYKKYFKLYEDQKKISDAARHVANNKYAIYEQKKEVRENLEQQRAYILSSIAEKERCISQLEYENQNLSSQQNSIRNYEIPNRQRERESAQSNVYAADRQIQNTQAALARETDPQRRQALQQQLNNETNQRNSLQQRVYALDQEINNLYSRLSQIDSQISSNYSYIDRLRSEISSLYNQLPSEEQIESARGQERQAYNVYKEYDAVADREEGITATKRKQYEKVLSKFEAEKTKAILLADQNGSEHGEKEALERAEAEAIQLGTATGLKDGKDKGEKEGRDRDFAAGFEKGKVDGPRDGAVKGDADGLAAGQSEGRQNGMRDGLAAGFEKGHKRGYDETYPLGYEAANGPANYERGIVDGQAKGEEEAQNTAMSEDYPRGKKDAEKELRAAAPSQTITINNATKTLTGPSPIDSYISSPIYRSRNELNSFSMTVKIPDPDFRYRVHRTFTHPEVTAAYNDLYDRSYVNAFKKIFESIYPQKYEEFYKKNFQIAYDQALGTSYPDSFKVGYDQAYKQGFDPAYATARKAAYDRVYTGVYNTAYAEGLPQREQEGYEKGKEDGFAQGKKDAETKAYTQGFDKGRADAYASSLDGARKAAYEKGKADMKLEYDSNYKVAAVSAKLVEGTDDDMFVLNEKVSLAVKIRNFGGKEAPQGALTVKVKDLKGTLKLKNTEAMLKPLPGKTLATYTSTITGRVVKEEPEEAEISLEIKVFEGTTLIGTYKVNEDIFTLTTEEDDE